MIQRPGVQKSFLFSTLLHVLLLILVVCSIDFSAPMPVVSNTDSKIINAVALMDSPFIAPPSKRPEEKPEIKPQPVETPTLPSKPIPEKMAANKIANTPTASKAPSLEKKLAIDEHKKEKPEKTQNNTFKKDLTKQLLADLDDEISKQAKVKQKMMKKKFSQQLKSESEKALQQMLKEQKSAASKRSQHTQGVIDKYKALILQAIAQQWVVPSHVNKRLYCELLIRLAPGGVVLNVQVTKSSGDNVLDRSARAAVFRASPLPVPDDIISFESFRQFVLKVKPENIQPGNGEQGFWLG